LAVLLTGGGRSGSRISWPEDAFQLPQTL